MVYFILFSKKFSGKLKPIVFSGPSGAGKGTLIDLLMKEFPNRFGFSVSHTTRKPRPGEKDGIHYHFTDVEHMLKEIEEGKFVEHAHVHGNYYGTSKRAVEEVLNSGRVCLLDIDVQGAEQVKKSSLRSLYIFVMAPSLDILEKRLRGRGTENEESLKTRLLNAKREMEYAERPDFFDLVLINDDLPNTYSQLKEWIFNELSKQT